METFNLLTCWSCFIQAVHNTRVLQLGHGVYSHGGSLYTKWTFGIIDA